MKNKVIHISDLHFDHMVWTNALQFQKDMLSVFTRRLEEVVTKWSNIEVLKRVEHFQNSFLRHSNIIDEYLHDIKIHEESLVARTKENPTAIDRVHFEDHTEHRDKIETQESMYSDLKKEFLVFLREAM